MSARLVDTTSPTWPASGEGPGQSQQVVHWAAPNSPQTDVFDVPLLGTRIGFSPVELLQIGRSVAGDSCVFSLGATLVQSADCNWDIGIRRMDINRVGAPDSAQIVTAGLLEITDTTLPVKRDRLPGRVELGLAPSDESSVSSANETDIFAYPRWSSS